MCVAFQWRCGQEDFQVGVRSSAEPSELPSQVNEEGSTVAPPLHLRFKEEEEEEEEEEERGVNGTIKSIPLVPT